MKNILTILVPFAFLFLSKGMANELQGINSGDVFDLNPSSLLTHDFCNDKNLESELIVNQVAKYLADDKRHFVNQRVVAIYINAARKIVNNTNNLALCQKTFERGLSHFYNVYEDSIKQLEAQNAKQDFENSNLKQEKLAIQKSWFEDQSSRIAYIALMNPDKDNYSDYWAFELAKGNAVYLDGEHREMIKALIQKYGWIDEKRFGLLTSRQALTLIQHADADPEFQLFALKEMESRLASDEIDKIAFANLWDRVSINNKLKQRYGTQPKKECNSDGTLSIYPVEDAKNLPTRRKKLGLEPLFEQQKRLAKERCSK